MIASELNRSHKSNVTETKTWCVREELCFIFWSALTHVGVLIWSIFGHFYLLFAGGRRQVTWNEGGMHQRSPVRLNRRSCCSWCLNLKTPGRCLSSKFWKARIKTSISRFIPHQNEDITKKNTLSVWVSASSSNSNRWRKLITKDQIRPNHASFRCHVRLNLKGNSWPLKLQLTMYFFFYKWWLCHQTLQSSY